MGVRKYKALSKEVVALFELHGVKLIPQDVEFTTRITHADPLRCRIERNVRLTFTEEITSPAEIEKIINQTPKR